jgi:glyoxylase I family protein
MLVEKIHHVAYRCRDARETVEFYKRFLDMDYLLAFSEDHVPSTGEPDPYMHVFLDAGNGNVLAFFEVPNSPPMGRDPNTPAWINHIAFKVKDEATLLAARERLIAGGLDVLGPTDHGLFRSIYFHDPNGHRLELAADVATTEMYRDACAQAAPMLEEWTRNKKTQKQNAWLHAGEFERK